MHLPALARDLYKSQKEVEALEVQLQGADNVARQEHIKDQLRQAKGELEQLRRIMAGRKENAVSSSSPRRFFQ